MRRLSVTSMAAGLALVAVGTLLVLDADDVLALGFGWLAPLLVGAVGAVLVISGAAAKPADAGPDPDSAPPPTVHRPASLEALPPTYRRALGRLVVDLTALELPPGPTEVKVQVDMGEAHVIVPAGASVLVDAHAAVGTVDALGERRGGIAVDVRRDERTDGPRLLLDVRTSMGHVHVARA